MEEEEEEEDEDSAVEGSKKKGRGRANGEPRMKMRRIFRITHGRERQRGERSKYMKSHRNTVLCSEVNYTDLKMFQQSPKG